LPDGDAIDRDSQEEPLFLVVTIKPRHDRLVAAAEWLRTLAMLVMERRATG
jgi:hypothetical protein